jgi:hypothetical protein
MICKSKRLCLVIILMAALVFMGISFLKAKKPLQWEWEVDIPGANEGWNLYAYNADGYPYGNLFKDTDSIFVRVKRHRRTPNSFRLIIEKDQLNKQKIGFQNLGLTLRTDVEPSGEGPCSFPDYGPCLGSYDDAPDCLEFFLVNYAHPYTDPGNYYDYNIVGLFITVDCDIEGMNSGTVSPSGNVYIEMNKTDDILPTGCEDLHSIVVARDVDEGSGIIKITRVAEDSWCIEVDTTDNDTIYFTEAYCGYRGKGKGKLVTKKPIRAEAPFRFTTTWTRWPQ